MPAPSTRVATATLTPLVRGVEAELDTVEATLSTLLVVLTAYERKHMPRTRTGFAAAARVFVNLLLKRPEIAAVCRAVPEGIVEDLDNVELIEAVLPRLKTLVQMLEDSRLQWLAEAQDPTLQAYGVAQVLAERDGSLAEFLEPLAKVMSNAPPEAADETVAG
jgi:hypothetical protein